jgi:hypothetical protein
MVDDPDIIDRARLSVKDCELLRVDVVRGFGVESAGRDFLDSWVIGDTDGWIQPT